MTTFVYDGAGRRVEATDALGHSVEWTLNENGQPTQVDEVETTGHGSAKTFVTEMVYDNQGRVTTHRRVDETNSSNKHSTTFEYSSLGVMTKRTDAESNFTDWSTAAALCGWSVWTTWIC